MSIENFYKIGSKLSGVTLQAHAVSLNSEYYDTQGKKGEGIVNLLLGNYKGIKFPILFKQNSGKRLDDVLDTGTAILYLISERFKKVLEENEITGWKTFPIILLDKKGLDIPGYYGFSITGRCGPINYKRSEIFQKSIREGGPLLDYYRGLHIGLDQWDGSDFFLPAGFFGKIVTEKVAKILKKEKISNVSLRKLSEVELSGHIVKKYL